MDDPDEYQAEYLDLDDIPRNGDQRGGTSSPETTHNTSRSAAPIVDDPDGYQTDYLDVHDMSDEDMFNDDATGLYPSYYLVSICECM